MPWMQENPHASVPKVSETNSIWFFFSQLTWIFSARISFEAWTAKIKYGAVHRISKCLQAPSKCNVSSTFLFCSARTCLQKHWACANLFVTSLKIHQHLVVGLGWMVCGACLWVLEELSWELSRKLLANESWDISESVAWSDFRGCVSSRISRTVEWFLDSP